MYELDKVTRKLSAKLIKSNIIMAVVIGSIAAAVIVSALLIEPAEKGGDIGARETMMLAAVFLIAFFAIILWATVSNIRDSRSVKNSKGYRLLKRAGFAEEFDETIERELALPRICYTDDEQLNPEFMKEASIYFNNEQQYFLLTPTWFILLNNPAIIRMGSTTSIIAKRREMVTVEVGSKRAVEGKHGYTNLQYIKYTFRNGKSVRMYAEGEPFTIAYGITKIHLPDCRDVSSF